jgi:hypothetical protein
MEYIMTLEKIKFIRASTNCNVFRARNILKRYDGSVSKAIYHINNITESDEKVLVKHLTKGKKNANTN